MPAPARPLRLATYVGVVAVFIAYLAASGVLGNKPELETAMAWGEPFGAAAFGLATKYWTSAERNTLWILLAVATANVIFGIWRPRLTKLRD